LSWAKGAEAAQRPAFAGKRVVVLDEFQVDAGIGESAALVDFRQEAARVAEFPRRDDLDIGDLGRLDIQHCSKISARYTATPSRSPR
jgi:hypothetical protein